MSNKNVLIFGDVMIDAYIHGSVSRISPEAPVPVLRVTSQETKIGGAGNVANNLTALGANASALFLTGMDADAGLLQDLLQDRGIDCKWLVKDRAVKTIKKERAICKNQQIVRMDYNDSYELSDSMRAEIKQKIPEAVQWADVVIISDYAKGTCEPELCGHLIGQCRKQGKPVIVDPKGRDWEKYRGATVITPNMNEINIYSGKNVPNENSEIEKNFGQLYEELGVDYVLLTRSEKGMSLIGNNTIHHIEAVQREVYDVSGAGDTVVATLASVLENSLSNIQFAVEVSNIAAGIVVAKPGTAVVTKKELYQVLNGSEDNQDAVIYRMKDRNALLELIERWRAAGDSIVTTNGCFDIIHKGHVRLLSEASKYADHLIVAINTDASVKRLKGEKRPINGEAERAYVIASMKNVDAVVLFDPLEDNQYVPENEIQQLPENLRGIAAEAPMGILRLIQPDVHAKGGDYTVGDVPEAMYAGKFVSIPFVEGFSTTNTLKKCQ